MFLVILIDGDCLIKILVFDDIFKSVLLKYQFLLLFENGNEGGCFLC